MSIPTLLITAATVLAALAGLMVFFASQRRLFPGFREWALAQVLGSLGLLLLALRGTLPELVSVVGGNLLILAHPILALRGFHRFYGVIPRRGSRAEVGLLLVGATLLVWFTTADPDVSARIVVFGVVGGLLHLNTGVASLVVPEARNSRTQWVLSAAFVALAAASFARAGWHAMGRHVPGLFADPTLSAFVLVAVTSQVVFVCGLVYLNFDRADEALLENEGRLRLAQEAARAGSWEADLATGRTFWSEGLWALYGIAPASCQPSQEAWLGTVCPEDRPRVKLLADAAARDGGELEVEWRVLGSSPERWLLTRGRTLRDGGERPARLVGIVLDVTDRKHAEEARRAVEREKTLRESEARFRALIEKSTDVVVVLDRDRVFRFFSPGGTAALGWQEAEVLGRRASELIHPDDEPRVSAQFDSLLADPEATAHTTYRARHRDGTWRVLDSVARNHLGDQALGGVVVNARDITEQLRLRERLADAQRLESIGQLAGGVAHDFNNLLTAILGGAECVRDSLDDGEPPLREDIETVLDAAKRASELTRQLLAFARRQPVVLAPIDLDGLAREMERLVRRLLPESITLKVEGAPAPWHVRADAGQLRQVILNLTANARDAMPAGGHLTIETQNQVLDAEAGAFVGAPGPGEYARLTVRDTGLGVSPDAMAHLFEPFFTTKGLGRGTGLGLAAVHGIVKQGHGAIAVESEPGRGTAIHIYLPRCAPGEPTPEPPALVPSVGGHERVLLVEDEPLVRNVAERALRKAGYDVLVAHDAEEALGLAIPDGGISLLITDVVMPGLDGGELAGRLQTRHRGLRVLYVSGFTHDAIAHHGVLDAGVEFLEKPFVAAVLIERVRRVLDRPPRVSSRP